MMHPKYDANMPQLNNLHLDELTKLSLSNRRELVKLRRTYRAVVLPLALFTWLTSLLILKAVIDG